MDKNIQKKVQEEGKSEVTYEDVIAGNYDKNQVCRNVLPENGNDLEDFESSHHQNSQHQA